MEEDEKLTETELREDAESYMGKLRLRSEFAIIIGVCYAAAKNRKKSKIQ